MRTIFPIIIPHQNRHDLLKNCLESIPSEYPVYIISGGTFAENCNKGFQLIKEKAVFFLNDDTIVNAFALLEAEKKLEKADIVGLREIRPDSKNLMGVRVEGESSWPLKFVEKEADFPTGAAFLIKSKTFRELGMFDEIYKNGGEDVELFLKALEKNYKIDFTEIPIVHNYAQSKDRFRWAAVNHEILTQRFPITRLRKIFPGRTFGN